MPGVCGTSTPDESTVHDSSGVMSTPAAATPNSLAVLGPDQAPSMAPLPDDGHSSGEEDNITMKLHQLPSVAFEMSRSSMSFLGKSSAAGLLKVAITLCTRFAPDVDARVIFQGARKYPSVSSLRLYSHTSHSKRSSGWMIYAMKMLRRNTIFQNRIFWTNSFTSTSCTSTRSPQSSIARHLKLIGDRGFTFGTVLLAVLSFLYAL